jgi:hypothetical protein
LTVQQAVELAIDTVCGLKVLLQRRMSFLVSQLLLHSCAEGVVIRHVSLPGYVLNDFATFLAANLWHEPGLAQLALRGTGLAVERDIADVTPGGVLRNPALTNICVVQHPEIEVVHTKRRRPVRRGRVVSI